MGTKELIERLERDHPNYFKPIPAFVPLCMAGMILLLIIGTMVLAVERKQYLQLNTELFEKCTIHGKSTCFYKIQEEKTKEEFPYENFTFVGEPRR